MFFGTAVFWIACTSNSVEEIGQPSTNACDTANVTYTAVIRPILQERQCLSCHNAQVASAGIRLDDISSARQFAGRMYKAVNHDPSLNPSQYMPPTGSKIPTCEIDKIGAWINQGLQE